MYQECQNLKVKILDPSNNEIKLEIKQSLEELKEVGQTMDNLGREQSNIKEKLSDVQSIVEDVKKLQDFQEKVKEDLENPIPWNIRGKVLTRQRRKYQITNL